MLFLNCAFFNQMQAIKNLEYYYDSLEIGMPSLAGMSTFVNVKIYNPNKANVTIKKVSYIVIINGIEFAQGFTDDEVTIKGKGSAVYRTKVNFKFSDIMSYLGDVFKSKKYIIRVKGDATVKTAFGAHTFPFDITKDISEISE